MGVFMTCHLAVILDAGRARAPVHGHAPRAVRHRPTNTVGATPAGGPTSLEVQLVLVDAVVLRAAESDRDVSRRSGACHGGCDRIDHPSVTCPFGACHLTVIRDAFHAWDPHAD